MLPVYKGGLYVIYVTKESLGKKHIQTTHATLGYVRLYPDESIIYMLLLISYCTFTIHKVLLPWLAVPWLHWQVEYFYIPTLALIRQIKQYGTLLKMYWRKDTVGSKLIIIVSCANNNQFWTQVVFTIHDIARMD